MKNTVRWHGHPAIQHADCLALADGSVLPSCFVNDPYPPVWKPNIATHADADAAQSAREMQCS
ncbi:rCG28941 [Anopheles sinensis]|uniref:RCG28941 n=1 Tax=Anopheles sinensis TaxID=74873 RepID=A0A084WCS6_ANOSI|nr:rCG28941 [Anopheles sinensis]